MRGSSGQAAWKYKADVDDPRRRGRRHKVDSLTCDLGVVLDLSNVGMRVASASKPPLSVGQSGRIKLKIPEGSLVVTGCVVWLRRVGLRKHQLGIEFINTTRSVGTALERLAQFGFIGFGDPSETVAGAGAGRGGERRNRKDKVRATIDIPDYYGILEIESDASPDAVKAAFRAMALQFHPDVSDDPTGVAKFVAAQEAYEILRDEGRRRRYDRRRAG